MAFDDILEKLKDAWNTQWAQIQDSQAYYQLKEKYDDLAPEAQTAVKIVSGLVMTLLALLFPLIWYSSSSSEIAEFESNRTLIKDLLQVRSQMAATPEMIPQYQEADVKARVDNAINVMGFLPEQIKGSSGTQFTSPAGANLIPKQLTQKGVEVKLAKLNLKQIVEMNYKFQSTLPEGMKVLGLEMIRSHGTTNYYDVTYRVASLSVPGSNAVPIPGGGPALGGPDASATTRDGKSERDVHSESLDKKPSGSGH